MRSIYAVLVAAMTFTALPVNAAPEQPSDRHDKPAKPITQREPNAIDIVTTPMSDLNIRKGEIPQILIDAQDAPYSLRGMKRCNQIAAEVTRLDSVLGDDIDIAQSRGRRISAGKMAQSVVGSFIPFRGIIREISGANEQERRVQTAIYAGSVRRSFLKGIGQQRDCPWPARSATLAMLAKLAREADVRAKAKDDDNRQNTDNPASEDHRRR